MRSRINGNDNYLSSQEFLYVGAASFYDWINSLTHAYEIAKAPMYAGNYYESEGMPDLSMLATPFQNYAPYNTDLLSANPNSTPGTDAFAPGKHRAYRWLELRSNTKLEQLNMYEKDLFSGASDMRWDQIVYYPVQMLLGKDGPNGELCSIFEAWPGLYSYDSYNQMWSNFLMMAVCGADPDLEHDNVSIRPPLYSPGLSTLHRFGNASWVWSYGEADAKAEEAYQMLASDTAHGDAKWINGFSLGIRNFGNQLFQYGQLGFSGPLLNNGIVLPLLQFVDFCFSPSTSYSDKLYSIAAEATQQTDDFREHMVAPDLLSAATQVELSTVYPAWVGAGVDSEGHLYFKRGDKKSYSLLDYQANQKLLYAGYVAICDLYRSFCTTKLGEVRAHNRWATVENVWEIREIQCTRHIEHRDEGAVLSFWLYDDHAEVDVEYNDISHQSEVSSDVYLRNTITTARKQAQWQVEDGDPLQFVRDAELDMASCFVKTPDLRPNPDSPIEEQNWLDRLFPPDPEDKRQQDLDELEQEYLEKLAELEDQLSALEAEIEALIDEETIAIGNAEIDLMVDVFQHFGYSAPAPVPHLPESGIYFDYYSWFDEKVLEVTENDPTLPTEDDKIQRQEQMYQYLNDLLDIAWDTDGEIYKIAEEYDAKINEKLDQAADIEKQIEELDDKYQNDRFDILFKEYPPELPSDQDINRILNYVNMIGTVSTTGNGTGFVQTMSDAVILAPLNGYYDRKYTGDYQDELSDNSTFWPAPALMCGPEKDYIYVEEYLPYKVHSYSGDLSGTEEWYVLSDSVFGAFAGYDAGKGYHDMMSNAKRNNYMFSLLQGSRPLYWKTPAGDFNGYKGTFPTIPDLPRVVEHLSVEYQPPVVEIKVKPDYQQLPTKLVPTQVTVLFNGEKRSDLTLQINGENFKMSSLANAVRIGAYIIGTAQLQPRKIDPKSLKFWNNGPNSEYTKYQQCDFYLRCGSFVLH